MRQIPAAEMERRRAQYRTRCRIAGTLARNDAMLAARERGLTYAEIAERHGVTVERVRQIVSRARQMRDTGPQVSP